MPDDLIKVEVRVYFASDNLVDIALDISVLFMTFPTPLP